MFVISSWYNSNMEKIEKAFHIINRSDFVPESTRDKAFIDIPLPIGYGQTISQPSTVKSMLYWLDLKVGEKVLDIGSGSGWTTALLSTIVGREGKVYAVELIPELLKFGKLNCKKVGIKNANFYLAGKNYGLPNFAPFDKILVSASANRLPIELIDQLKIGGKIVIPVLDDILEITKTSDKNFKTINHPGYIFVPLIDYKK